MGLARIRILLLADTHLGLDLPVRPRVDRRRRGEDFVANFEAALSRALEGDVHLVVHGGDVFHRSRVPDAVVDRAFEPMRRVAGAGVPLVVVPGNHERGRLPDGLLARHDRIHVFDRPRTIVVPAGGLRVALSGFPYARRVRDRFADLVRATAPGVHRADLHLLCMHHCFEGATVGPRNWTFRDAPDVVAASSLPSGFAAVLAGHIHRHQILTHGLDGRALRAPVLYPGSVERTSIAERDEDKGYLLVDLVHEPSGRWRVHPRFVPLPARPMCVVQIADGDPSALDALLRRAIDRAPADAVLTIRVRGELRPGAAELLAARRLRTLAPATMNVRASFSSGWALSRRPR